MASPPFQHPPSTADPPAILHPCEDCVLGACREVGAPWALCTSFASKERKKILHESPHLPFRPPSENGEIWRTNLKIQIALYKLHDYEQKHREASREFLKQLGLQPKFNPDVFKTLSAKERQDIPSHKTNLSNVYAIAAQVAIRQALLSGTPQAPAVRSKRVRKTGPRYLVPHPEPRISPRPALQTPINHSSALHVPENIIVPAVPVDDSTWAEGNAQGISSLMGSNISPRNCSMPWDGISLFPALQWESPYTLPTPKMSGSSSYQSSPSDNSSSGPSTFSPIQYQGPGEYSPPWLPFADPSPPLFHHWNEGVYSPNVSIPGPSYTDAFAPPAPIAGPSYTIPFPPPAPVPGPSYTAAVPPAVPENIDSSLNESFWGQTSNDSGVFYTDEYRGTAQAWNGFR